MRAASVALVVMSLAATQAAAEPESAVACSAFKEGWAMSLQRLEPGRPPLSFTPAPDRGRSGERVGDLDGVEAWISCPDGKLRHVEIRQSGGGAAAPALVRAASGILMAFDGEITPAQAADLVAALGADARAGHDAVSGWGAYELTFGRPAGSVEFTADLHGS